MSYKIKKICCRASTLALLALFVALFTMSNALAQTANQTIYAIATDPNVLGATPTQRIISFNANSPGTLISDVPVTGLPSGDMLRGLDFRPANGQIYAVSTTSRLYTLNPTIGTLTLVGQFSPNIPGGNFFAFNFNPVPDRIRAVGNVASLNVRVNPNDATGTADGNITFASGDPNAADVPNLVALSYDNNIAGATFTTAFGIDARFDGTARLVTIGSRNFGQVSGQGTSPNTGQLFTVANIRTSNGAVIRTNNYVGFDIAQNGVAYASFTPINPYNAPSSLYTLDTASGIATLIGQIGNGLRISGLTVALATTGGTPNPALANIQFSPVTYTVAKNAGSVTLTVTRTGDTTATQTISYQTVAGTATASRNFVPTTGTLTFAPGETTKTITVLVSNNAFVEGDRSFLVTLTDPNGGTASGAGQVALVTVTETNTTTPNPANPIDTRDFFVRQQYIDFLNRLPDDAGFAFWTTQYDQRVAACNNLLNRTNLLPYRQCVLSARASISAAFFLSQEFQQTGYLVYRTYDVAFARLGATRPAAGQNVTQTAVRFEEYLPDVQAISRGVVSGQSGSDQILQANTQAFFMNFVQRAAFVARFPTTQTGAQFVDALFASAGITPTTAERQAAITAFGGGDVAGRAAALQSVVNNETEFQREFNRAFVLMEYFGYLLRNPDDPPDNNLNGYNFWLRKLDAASQVGENVRDQATVLRRIQRAVLIEAFIDSTEYRSRFGPPEGSVNNGIAQQ